MQINGTLILLYFIEILPHMVSGTYHITLCSDAKPIIHAPWKCLIAMWPLVCEKLDEFMEQGIIIPVEEPTDWVSSLAYSWKANGKLSVCLDP